MTAPVPTQRTPWPFHDGSPEARDAALRAHYGRLPGRRRTFRHPLRLIAALAVYLTVLASVVALLAGVPPYRVATTVVQVTLWLCIVGIARMVVAAERGRR